MEDKHVQPISLNVPAQAQTQTKIDKADTFCSIPSAAHTTGAAQTDGNGRQYPQFCRKSKCGFTGNITVKMS